MKLSEKTFNILLALGTGLYIPQQLRMVVQATAQYNCIGFAQDIYTYKYSFYVQVPAYT